MRKRNIQIPLRLNNKEYNHLQKSVDKTGYSREKLLRNLIMGVDIKPRLPDEYTKIYRLLSNLTNNVNQIAHHANATGCIDLLQIDATVIMVEKCWQHIKQLR